MIENEVRSRDPIRERLEADLQTYFGNGGKVKRIPQSEISGSNPRFNNKGAGILDADQECE